MAGTSAIRFYYYRSTLLQRVFAFIRNLAIRANEWLKDGGLLIAMYGQSYVNCIYELMSRHLDYYWTGSYSTPGQPTPMRHVNVNSIWKMLLMFKKEFIPENMFSDGFTSDGNDKTWHKWGQSVSGMQSTSVKSAFPVKPSWIRFAAQAPPAWPFVAWLFV